MDITKFEHGDQKIEVHVNMGSELYVYNSFQDVDGTIFRSGIAYLDIEVLEKIVEIAKQARDRHTGIVTQWNRNQHERPGDQPPF